MGTFWIVKVAKYLHVDGKDSDQTAQMHRLRLTLSLRWAYMSDGMHSHVMRLLLFCGFFQTAKRNGTSEPIIWMKRYIIVYLRLPIYAE